MIKIPEYMAMGCPVASYDLRESRISAGDAAVYAEPGDVAGASAAARRAARRSRAARATMREAALAAVADRLAWQHQIPALLAAYDRASGRPARPGGAEPAALSAATPA